MLSNGFCVGVQGDPARTAARDAADLLLVAASARGLSTGIGGWPESQQIRPSPCSVRREATVRSSLPSSIVISSR